MEQNSTAEQSLFGLSLDQQSKGFLYESAKWGKFLSIVGFVFCALIVLGGIVMATQANEIERSFDRNGYQQTGFGDLGPAMAIVYIVIAVVYFFPCLYLLRFSNHMRAALQSGEQGRLTTAFQNMKSMFKFVGILTIVIIAIYIISIVMLSIKGSGGGY